MINVQIFTIPRLDHRLRAMVFRRSFEQAADEVNEQLVRLHAAAHELRTSQRLKQVLHVSRRLRRLSLVP